MITLSFSKSILEKLQDNLLIALRLSNIRLYRFAGALLSYAEGLGIKEIAKLMGGGHKSHHQFADSLYLQRYEVVDRFALSGSRTQRKLTKAQQAQLVKLIKDGPEANGFHCGIWNSAMIA
jgi:hypothetical protein